MSARRDCDDVPAEDDTPTDHLAPCGAQSDRISATPPETASASCILRSRYVLEEVIGRGGMSIIYRARDLHRDLPQDVSANFVAIKVLRTEQRDNPWALTRLKREFRQMQSLSHPGIVRVFDLDCDDDIWFMSMELVAGRTVKAWMTTHDSRTDGLRIIRSCCEALEHAHSLGIVHADLKSTNVMVAADGTIKLIDFSSAPNLTGGAGPDADSNLAVTPLYASPQVLAGKTPEQRDDVFSLACLSYSVLSGGRHPFGGHPSLEDGRVKLAPTYVRSIPVELFKVLEQGLSAERERRPSSVAEFLRQLTAAERQGNEQSVRAIEGISPAIAPVTIKEIHSVPRHWLTAHTTAGARGSYRRVWPFVRLTAMVAAIAVAAVVFRLGTYRGAIRAADLPSEAATASTVPETSAPSAGASPEHAASLPAAAWVHDSGVISFDAPTIRASAAQSVVALTVKRRAATATPGAFVWRVDRGSAYPGVDYERMEPQVVRFAEGQKARTLFIPLIRSRATLLARGPRTFTVQLQQMAGGPALGRFAHVTVALDSVTTSNMVATYQVR
jgi:tRNA A-37 threonylcarbamoyl transferase component Bud32